MKALSRILQSGLVQLDGWPSPRPLLSDGCTLALQLTTHRDNCRRCRELLAEMRRRIDHGADAAIDSIEKRDGQWLVMDYPSEGSPLALVEAVTGIVVTESDFDSGIAVAKAKAALELLRHEADLKRVSWIKWRRAVLALQAAAVGCLAAFGAAWLLGVTGALGVAACAALGVLAATARVLA